MDKKGVFIEKDLRNYHIIKTLINQIYYDRMRHPKIYY